METAGILVNMKTESYPRFSPVRTLRHPLCGTIKCYTLKRLPRSDDEGAQTLFFRNNAEVNNSRQYGIKLFKTLPEAFAAYQRQRIAARGRVAPPVGSMVMFRIGLRNWWGYQTCIADTKCPALTFILSWVSARNSYDMWSKFAVGNTTLNAENAKRWWNSYAGRDFRKTYHDTMDYFENSKLGDRLAILSKYIPGTQYDNLRSFVYPSDANPGMRKSKRLLLGGVWTKEDRPLFCSDLHGGNVGVWKGRAVCIDFGYHCVDQRGNLQNA